MGECLPQANVRRSSIIDAWRRGAFEVLICGALLQDVGDALIELGEPEAEVQQYLLAIGAAAELVVIRHQAMGVRDATDNVVLETAIGGRADYLVTYDKDLLELKLSVAEYVTRHGLQILRDTRVQEGELDFCTVLRSLVAEQ